MIITMLGQSNPCLPFLPVTPENEMTMSVVSLNILDICIDADSKTAIGLVTVVIVADWVLILTF